MAGLFHTLGMGADSLFASRQGVDTAGHNIANAQVEGFSRQRVDLTQREPNDIRNVIIGNGAFVKTITRAHDRYLEKHIVSVHQEFGESETLAEELKALEDIYSPELNATVANELSNFFNALRSLSNFPEELSVRAAVRENGYNLALAFQRVDQKLRESQYDINQKIQGEIEEVNTLLNNIAELNVNILNLEAGPDRTANDLRDQQERLVRKLSEKIDLHYYTSDRGMMVIRGPGDILLVDRGHHSTLGAKIKPGSADFIDVVAVDSQDRLLRDMTDIIKSGRLRALIDVRDDKIANLLDHNNTLALSVADNVNAIHRQGFGLNQFKHTIGRNFFQISRDKDQAGQSIDLSSHITESTDAISAAASPDAPGDNVVLNNIIRLETEKLMADKNATFNDYYSNYVGVLGLDVVRSAHLEEADKLLLDDLMTRRESIAGVSMDEEAMSLLKWQSNFTASSRVITTVDEMLETVLGLKR